MAFRIPGLLQGLHKWGRRAEGPSEARELYLANITLGAGRAASTRPPRRDDRLEPAPYHQADRCRHEAEQGKLEVRIL